MYIYLRRFFEWLRRRPPGEPPGLYRLFKVGVCLLLLGAVAAMIVAWRGCSSCLPQDLSKVSWRCKLQLDNRAERETELNNSLTVSEDRVNELKKALSNPNSPAYVDARSAISVEENLQRDIKRKLKALNVESLRDSLRNYVIGFLLLILFALLTARLAASHGFSALGKWDLDGKLTNWRRPYWFWVLLIFGTHTAREISTSVLQTQGKSWFAWSSFCVSSGAWTLNLVSVFGVAMLVAYPVTILWHFGRSSNIPLKLNFKDADGKWGVGSYLLFLQTWVTLSLVSLLLPGALWLRLFKDDPRFSREYLLPSVVLFASLLVISGRMIRNAILIRRTYYTELKGLGKTWQEIQEKKPPPDPTITFLGEHWWKLPTVILAIFAFLWLIVNQLGVSDFLQELTGMK